MPKAECLVCGQKYEGWALKYKDCYCCGVKLITERERIRKKTIKDLALESIAKDLNIVNEHIKGINNCIDMLREEIKNENIN